MKTEVLLVFCLALGFNLYAQNDTRGIIGGYPPIKNFQAIPYTGPTGQPESLGIQGNSSNRKANRADAELIDSLIWEDVVPAGTTYTMKYDFFQNGFTTIAPFSGLTTEAKTAIAASPVWMKEDLYDNFRRLDSSLQKEYAQLIIDADSLIRDEVAFQVAHLSPNMSLIHKQHKGTLVANAQGIYKIAPDLKYVKLVEYGSAATGDWYTTTSYRIINSAGDTVWKEIPRDIYYWWVVMPVIYEEIPKMDSTVHNEFWRTYVYDTADAGYPVLKDVLKDVTVFWDGKSYHWDNRNGSTPLPFSDTMTAVQVLGRWVAQTITEDAIAPRPIQPNITLYDHNGNCGEIQQMQTSGGRAGLFPLMPVCTWPGDHIWNEIYWPDSGQWAFYQIARVGGPTDINWTWTWPTSACITAMRADGYRWMINEKYNPTLTVTVVVRDANRKPVDGAEVVFVAAPSPDPHSFTQSMIGSWGHTDENGQLTVQLATGINYFIRADWQNGHYPSNPALFYTLAYTAQVPGDHRWIYLDNGDHNLEEKTHSLVAVPQQDEHSIVVEYEVPYHITYGGSYWDYPLWQDDFLYSQKTEGGSISTFVCDDLNYYRYENDTEFDVFTFNDSVTSGQLSLDLKDQEHYYVGFSNRTKYNIAEYAKIKAYLYKNEGTGVNELNDASEVRVFPNPSNGRFRLERLEDNSERIEIVNSLGDVVYQSQFNEGESSREINLSAFAKGVYMLRAYNNENTIVKKLVIQ